MEYQYSPLSRNGDEIRLLHLLPGNRHDTPRILIKHFRFTWNKIPEYEALSYAWGDPTSRANVLVGQHGETSISITTNLATALPYLRKETASRTFWIDAICVNQNDLEERSQQVSLMASLYSRAYGVLVWLGPALDHTNEAMNCLGKLGRKVRVDWKFYTVVASSDAAKWDLNQTRHVADPHFRALLQFFSSPWFQRLWVWQELRCGGENVSLQCGVRRLKAKTISNAVFCLRSSYNHTPFLENAYRICDPRGTNLLESLEIARYLQCSDPRDKIFAILSLPRRFEASICLQADYTASVVNTYIDLVIRLLETQKRSNFLTCVQGPRNLPGLPSWAPDWTVNCGVGRLAFFNHTVGNSRASWSRSAGNLLSLRGKLVGTVDSVLPLHFPNGESLGTAHMIGPVLAFAMKAKVIGRDCGSAHLIRALARVMCSNGFAESHEPPAHHLLTQQQCISALSHVATHLTGFVDELDQEVELNKLAEDRVWATMRYYCKGRSLFIMKDGTLGLGPSSTRPGDQASFILGCKSAIMLRDDGQDRFEVVGEAYIDGLMQGEALLGQLPPNVEAILEFKESESLWYPAFRNRQTGKTFHEDPRLGLLPAGWRLVDETFPLDGPTFKHEVTGEVRVYWDDPRKDVEVLVERGVRLETLVLV